MRGAKRLKRRNKILLVLLGLTILSQLPFIYRRHQLADLRATIARLNAQRTPERSASLDAGYRDYKGVIHVHSMLGGHSTGSFQEIIRAARTNKLDFVVMTEHPAAEFDTAATTLKGMQSSILFINGSELSAANGDRLLLMPGDGASEGTSGGGAANTGPVPTTAREIIERARGRNELAFVAYPQEFRSWDAGDFNGIEVYNLYTDARRANALLFFFDGLWSYRSFPDLLFARFYRRPDEGLKKWDELLATGDAGGGHRLVAIAGNDAHSNIGFGLTDATGKQLLGVKLDPYERSFSVVRNHVLLEKDQPLTAGSLLAALAAGHSYLSFDLFCDATGFSFTARNANEQKIMGDEIGLSDELRLSVSTPVSSRLRLIRDGATLREEATGGSAGPLEFPVTQRGVYRIEAYLDQLPAPLRDKPWIISNPIYVR